MKIQHIFYVGLRLCRLILKGWKISISDIETNRSNYFTAPCLPFIWKRLWRLWNILNILFWLSKKQVRLQALWSWQIFCRQWLLYLYTTMQTMNLSCSLPKTMTFAIAILSSCKRYFKVWNTTKFQYFSFGCFTPLQNLRKKGLSKNLFIRLS
jgi:hypothetical protein